MPRKGHARHFTGTNRRVATNNGVTLASVDVADDQWGDGHVERYISVTSQMPLTTADARRVPAALLDAADQLDELS